MADSSPLSGEQIARLSEENRQLREERQQLREHYDQLKEELKELKRLLFGSKKERFVPAPDNQLSLGLTQDIVQPAVPLKQTVQYERIVKQVTKKASRQLFPAHLPRVEVVIQPQEDVSGMRKVGEEITEELDL
jgi:predicted nuclease with TOPRIM domain